MGRNRVAVTISIPPRLAEDYDRLARNTGKNRSQLFREMFELVPPEPGRGDVPTPPASRSSQGRELSILTEQDVERLVFGDR